MRKLVPLGFCFILVITKSFAQMPIQLFGGHQATEFDFMWFKDLDEKGRFSLFNFTFFSIDYQNESQNTSEILQNITYNITDKWGTGVGGRYLNGQFSPQLTISYQLETKNLYFTLFPAVQYFPSTKSVGYSLFGLLFYTPKINDKWSLFSQLALEPMIDNKQHIYSFQQVRLGLGLKDLFQFGIGANFEQFGIDFQTRNNLGVFIRKELH